MNCNDFVAAAGDLARDHLMDAAQRESALAHAASCAGCASRLADERALTGGLRFVAKATDEQAPVQSVGAASSSRNPSISTRVWGSAPRPEGASLLATFDGRMAASVSGGCVESAAAEAIQAAITRGTPQKVSWGVTHERAWEMGLSCGGTIRVYVEKVS